ncbi:hypothetical protein D3C71_1928380 [compost metagenome]
MRQCSIFSTVGAALEDQNPVVAAQILGLFAQTEVLGTKQCRNRLFLIETDFQAYHAVCLKMMTGLKGDGTIGIKPIVSAIERYGWIVQSHFRLKLCDHTGPYIRRI